jgi:hypothetical protein
MSVFNETVFLGGCPVIRPEGIYLDGHRVIRLGMGDVGVGAIERRNPLPPGRYWVDVFASKEAAFQNWLKAHKAEVQVISSETFEPIDDYEGRVWRLFKTTAPVPWEGPGLPTIAGADVNSSADTAQRPPPEKDLLDTIDVPLYYSRAKTALWIAGAVAVVAVGGAIIYYMPRRREPTLSSPYPEPSL